MATFKKLSIYLDENELSGARPLYKEVLNLLRAEGIRGATVFKGVFGWGPDGIVHTVTLLRASANLPLKIEVIEKEEVIQKILPSLKAIIKKGLITLCDLEVIFSSPSPIDKSKKGETC